MKSATQQKLTAALKLIKKKNNLLYHQIKLTA